MGWSQTNNYKTTCDVSDDGLRASISVSEVSDGVSSPRVVAFPVSQSPDKPENYALPVEVTTENYLRQVNGRAMSLIVRVDPDALSAGAYVCVVLFKDGDRDAYATVSWGDGAGFLSKPS